MISVRAAIPNSITCLNLISGSLACIAALTAGGAETWGGLTGFQWAYIAIAAAAVFDFLDGLMARVLHAFSAVGKELDSLSDLVSFGLAPALMLFAYISGETGGTGWAFASLWIAVMGALRLARFNVDDRQATSFIGLPIPANALFWMGALAWFTARPYPGTAVMVALVLLFPLLMVSDLKLFSLKVKSLRLRDNVKRYVLVLAAILFLATQGVSGLAWTIVFYILLALLPSK